MTEQSLNRIYSEIGSDAAQRLSRLMSSTDEGSTEPVRTPFLSAMPSEDVLTLFTDEVFIPHATLLNETLSSIEAHQKEKYGPRSIMRPWSQRIPSLQESYASEEVSDLIDASAMDIYTNAFAGSRRLFPASEETSYKAMKRTTSAGLPFMERKGLVLDEGRQHQDSEKDWPCVLFTRTQEMGKDRIVWGYPMSKLVYEGSIFLPFFQWYKMVDQFAALRGPDEVDRAITYLILTNGSSNTILSEDFSSFDSSVKGSLQSLGWHIIKTHYAPEFESAIERIQNVFQTIPIVTPNGIWEGEHGIPSGSWFTNVIGTLVHAYAQCLISDTSGRPFNGMSNQVMGDDGVQIIPDEMIDEVKDIYASIGLEFNEDKTFKSNDEVVYLQRYYSKDYMREGFIGGIYPVYRALNRLIHMERWTNVEEIDGKDYFAIRAITILENCKYHPMHEALVKWVVDNDKYSLEYSQSSLRQYIRKFGTKTITTIKNQFSDSVGGINNFETTKIINTL